MMTINKSNVVLVIVVVAAIAVASVVAVHGHGGRAAALGTYGSGNVAAAGLADTSTLASSTGSGATALDPAKQDPTLDQFHSRDPFIQATHPPSEESVSPTASPTSEPTPVSANIKVAVGSVGATYDDQKVGDKLPPAGSAFQIQSIDGANGVTFKLLDGYTINGSTQSTFSVSQSSTPTEVVIEHGNKTVHYLITVLALNYSGSSSGGGSGSGSGSGGSGGGSGGSSSGSSYTVGHSIKAVSIETHNGTPSATLVVDGTTYASKQVGDVVTTSWGQIKIVGINGPAQTVTILHADVQVTLHVGQSVSK